MAGPEAYFPLLRMSIGLQNEPKREEEPKEMDPERREWLKEAMSNLLKSPIDDMKAAIKTIKETESEDDKVGAVDSLVGFVEQVDLARDLHKIGGLSLMVSLLDDPSPRVRASAAQVLGTTVQNNPEPQTWAMELGALDSLSRLLGRSDATPVELTKSIFGLSSLIRHNDIAPVKFIKELKGFALLLDVLKKGGIEQDEMLRASRKAAYVLSYLISRAPAIVPPTASHTVPVIVQALEVHVHDADFRETAVKILHVFVTNEKVTFDKPLKDSIGKTTRAAMESAKKDDHDAVVSSCKEILSRVKSG